MMVYYRLFICFFVTIVALSGKAQQVDFAYTFPFQELPVFGMNGNASHIRVDDEENVYVLYWTSTGKIDIDYSSDTLWKSSCLVKYNKDGLVKYVWQMADLAAFSAIEVDDILDNSNRITSLDIDPAGRAFIIMNLQLSAVNYSRILYCISADGEIDWQINGLAGINETDEYIVRYGFEKKVYVHGEEFLYRINSLTGIVTDTLYSPGLLYTQLRLNSDSSVIVAADNLITAFADVDPGAATVYSVVNRRNSFVIKLDQDLHYVWHREVAATSGLTSSMQITGLSVNADDEIIVSGYTSNQMSLGYESTPVVWHAYGPNFSFIIKYNEDGALLNSGFIHGDVGSGADGFIHTDAQNNIYITGVAKPGINLNLAGGAPFITSDYLDAVPMIIKYTNDFEFVSLFQLKQTSGTGANHIYSFTKGPTGKWYICGDTKSMQDYDNGDSILILPDVSQTRPNPFIASYSFCSDPDVGVTAVNDMVCEGDSAFFAVDSTTGFTKTWQINTNDGNGFTDAGLFTFFQGINSDTLRFNVSSIMEGWKFRCLLFDNDCGALSETAILLITPTPSAEFTYSINQGGIVSFTNSGLNGDEVSWDFGDGTTVINGNAQLTHTYLSNGDYTVTQVISNSCGSDSISAVISISGLDVGFPTMQVSGFDFNRSETAVYLSHSLKITAVELYSITGTIVYKSQPDSFSVSILTGDLADGIYFLRAQTVAGSSVIKFY